MADTRNLDRKYIYKISRNGVFLGLLPNVITEPAYLQDINTSGTSMVITVGESADKQFDAPDFITTEDGFVLTTEDGVPLVTERQPDLVGNANSKALIRNNNDIEVWEFSPTYPNGVLIFSGWVSRWKARFGGGDTIDISCLSNGSELDNYPIAGTPTADQAQVSDNSVFPLFTLYKASDTIRAQIWQSFVPGPAATNLSGIDFKLSEIDFTGSIPSLQLDIYASQSDAEAGINSLGSTILMLATMLPVYTIQNFSFATPITVNPGSTYYARLSSLPGVGTAFEIAYQSGSPYASGSSRRADSNTLGAWEDMPFTADLYFKTYYTAGATSVPYSGTDPTLILRSIIDGYVARGGTINYASGSTVLTGTSRSYTFKINTILEGIKKCLELAPSDWYWYVDPATNTLYFKETSTTADHTFVYGRHAQELDVEAQIENIKNLVYFTGGDTGGNVYLYTSLSDSVALAANNGRVGLDRISDNRVTLSDTALALMQNDINTNKNEVYNTTITINADTYDINTISLGQTVGFKGYGNFVDNLLLQIVHIERHVDYVILGLGVLPKRASAQVEDITRSLNDVETIYNPTTPS